ncbi:MAG TPA: protoporphyrinogen oxidase [Acidobacteriota bacterium]|nr:protoporphyrinogen oxidase [Acidobacteriota bacterium]
MLEVLVIGGGISGLTVAHASGLYKRPGCCELWEGTGRLGGTIGTDRLQGYSVDWGPNGFLDREPLTLQLVDEIGLREQLEPANPKSEKRFIVKNGQLHPVPFSPAKIIATGLLGPLEKARIFCEPFIPARRDDGDESVFDFAARRIGRGAAVTFVDPMVSGIHGGLARELSLPSCFPIMREMETRYGGLVKALIARQLEKRRARNAAGAPRKKSGSPAGPGGHLTSFRSGLDVIVQRLEERMQPIFRRNRQVIRIRRNETGWEATDQTGLTVQARKIVVSCPTYSAASLVKDFDSELSAAFAAIPYAPIIVVATGHKIEDIRNPLDGFGFLIPRNQGLRTLGSIWTSSIFSERAPEGFVQFRSMLGGDGDHSVLELSDGELWATLRKELDPLIGIRNDPAFIRIFRWEYGIPQFKLGHRERRARIEQLAARHPGLYVAGNAYYGVGLNDCVKMAYRVARQISEP